MFTFRKPSPARVESFLSGQRGLGFSYDCVGVTRDGADPPKSFMRDHNRQLLGTGPGAFARAVEAVRAWEMFNIDWVGIASPGPAPIAEGTVVAVLAKAGPLWSINAARIVYVIDERESTGAVARFGFAYGTLPGHVEAGEERFVVEWRRGEDDSVWYDLLAYSSPRHVLARVGYPLARHLQKRFAHDSKRAMLAAVSGPDGTGRA